MAAPLSKTGARDHRSNRTPQPRQRLLQAAPGLGSDSCKQQLLPRLGSDGRGRGHVRGVVTSTSGAWLCQLGVCGHGYPQCSRQVSAPGYRTNENVKSLYRREIFPQGTESPKQRHVEIIVNHWSIMLNKFCLCCWGQKK